MSQDSIFSIKNISFIIIFKHQIKSNRIIKQNIKNPIKSIESLKIVLLFLMIKTNNAISIDKSSKNINRMNKHTPFSFVCYQPNCGINTFLLFIYYLYRFLQRAQ